MTDKYNETDQAEADARAEQPQLWWCPTCKLWVEPQLITYDERHDERYGGCGESVAY